MAGMLHPGIHAGRNPWNRRMMEYLPHPNEPKPVTRKIQVLQYGIAKFIKVETPRRAKA